MAPADEKRLAQAIEDLKSKPGIGGVSSRDGIIYIRPTDSTARERLNRGTMGEYNGFRVVLEQAHVRETIRRRKGILRVQAKVVPPAE